MKKRHEFSFSAGDRQVDNERKDVELLEEETGFDELKGEFYDARKSYSKLGQWLRENIARNVDFDSWILNGDIWDEDIDIEGYDEEDWLRIKEQILSEYIRTGKSCVLVEQAPRAIFEDFGGYISSDLKQEIFSNWIEEVGNVAAKDFFETYLQENKADQRQVHFEPEIMLSALRDLGISVGNVSNVEDLSRVFVVLLEEYSDRNSKEEDVLWSLSHARELMDQERELLEVRNHWRVPEANREHFFGAWVHLEKISELVEFARELRNHDINFKQLVESAKQDPQYKGSYVDLLGTKSAVFNVGKDIEKQDLMIAKMDVGKMTNTDIGERFFEKLTGQKPEGLIAGTRLFGGGWSFIAMNDVDFMSLVNADALPESQEKPEEYECTLGVNFKLRGVPVNISKLRSDDAKGAEGLRGTLLHEEQHAIWSAAPWNKRDARYFAKKKYDVPSRVSDRIMNEFSSFIVQQDLRDDEYYEKKLFLYLNDDEIKLSSSVSQWARDALSLLHRIEPYLKNEDDRAIIALCLREDSLDQAMEQLTMSVDLIESTAKQMDIRVNKQELISNAEATAEELYGQDAEVFRNRMDALPERHSDMFSEWLGTSLMREGVSVRTLLKDMKRVDVKGLAHFQRNAEALLEEFDKIRSIRKECQNYQEKYYLSELQTSALQQIGDLPADEVIDAFENYVEGQLFLESRDDLDVSPDQTSIVVDWLNDNVTSMLEDVRLAEEEGFETGRIPLGFSLNNNEVNVSRVWYERGKTTSSLLLEVSIGDDKKIVRADV